MILGWRDALVPSDKIKEWLNTSRGPLYKFYLGFENFLNFDTVAFSFVCGKYYPIID